MPTAAAAQPQTSAPATAPRLDQSQLTPAERAAIEDFLTKLDITNPDHVLLFGADAQKHISDFSESALQAVRTSDTGEVGKMLENLVVELKGFEADAEEPKGIFKIFHSADCVLPSPILMVTSEMVTSKISRPRWKGIRRSCSRTLPCSTACTTRTRRISAS